MTFVAGTCPHCRGERYGVALVRFTRPTRCEEVRMPCSTCGAEGTLSTARADRLNVGGELRRDRIARGLTVADEAARLGIAPAELNAREHGR